MSGDGGLGNKILMTWRQCGDDIIIREYHPQHQPFLLIIAPSGLTEDMKISSPATERLNI